MLKRLSVMRACIVLLGLAIFGLLALSVEAAPTASTFGDIGVCDPWYPQNCSAPLGRVSAGGSQYGVVISSAVAPTFPAGALGVLVVPVGTNNATGQCLMWRDDGTAPTGTVGNPAPANTPIWYFVKTSDRNSAPNASFQVIAASSASCTANFIYYR